MRRGQDKRGLEDMQSWTNTVKDAYQWIMFLHPGWYCLHDPVLTVSITLAWIMTELLTVSFLKKEGFHLKKKILPALVPGQGLVPQQGAGSSKALPALPPLKILETTRNPAVLDKFSPQSPWSALPKVGVISSVTVLSSLPLDVKIHKIPLFKENSLKIGHAGKLRWNKG